MRASELNWMQMEELLRREDRALVPLGCVEQHGYLSLATDAILAERLAVEAAEPLGVPVFPALAYGITPSFRAFPGTVSLRISTLLELVRDVLDGLASHGSRRVLIVNGHGGNAPVRSLCGEWMASHPGVSVRMHDWWSAPRVWAAVQRIDPVASHASWMESFPWTRVAGVTPPGAQKPMIDLARLQGRDPRGVREALGDGNYGGRYQRSDADMDAIWREAVAETRELIETGWA